MWVSVQPFCPETADYANDQAPIQSMALLGLYKFDGTVNPLVNSMFDGLKWNFLVVLSILFHRREMQLRGIWASSNFVEKSSDETVADQRDSTRSSVSSEDSIDLVTGTDLSEALATYQKNHRLDNLTAGITAAKRMARKDKMAVLDEEAEVLNSVPEGKISGNSKPSPLQRQSSSSVSQMSVKSNILTLSEQIYIENRTKNVLRNWILEKVRKHMFLKWVTHRSYRPQLKIIIPGCFLNRRGTGIRTQFVQFKEPSLGGIITRVN